VSPHNLINILNLPEDNSNKQVYKETFLHAK